MPLQKPIHLSCFYKSKPVFQGCGKSMTTDLRNVTINGQRFKCLMCWCKSIALDAPNTSSRRCTWIDQNASSKCVFHGLPRHPFETFAGGLLAGRPVKCHMEQVGHKHMHMENTHTAQHKRTRANTYARHKTHANTYARHKRTHTNTRTKHTQHIEFLWTFLNRATWDGGADVFQQPSWPVPKSGGSVCSHWCHIWWWGRTWNLSTHLM